MVRPRPAIQAGTASLDLPMTPMIDVVFQLIIFFLCTTSFQPLELRLPSPLNLPGSLGEAAAVPPELEHLTAVVIRLGRANGATVFTLNQQRYATLDDIRHKLHDLASIRRDVPVILDPAGDVAVAEVIHLYDLCRAEGFSRIQFAAPVEP
ncbi:MAG: ExbD/TolR family protein [Thermogutta sp.]